MEYRDPVIHIVGEAGTFAYKRSDLIRGDNFYALVFKGNFNGVIPVAIKRYQMMDSYDQVNRRELQYLFSHEFTHPNLIRYIGYAADNNFLYTATELCECSVADIIDPKKRNNTRLKTPYFNTIVTSLSPKDILRQSSEAVNFLHSQGLIHRNIHPENFLIACVDPNKDYFLIKLTDFQLSIEKNQMNNFGTPSKEGWVAPESFKDNIELDNKVDAFILGCYFFYVLSGGKHPFGRNPVEQRGRIMSKDDEVYHDSWDGIPEWIIDNTVADRKEKAEAFDVIKSLIKFEPKCRKSVWDILSSGYFYSVESYALYDNPNSPKPGLLVIVIQENHFKQDLDQKWDCCGVDYYGAPENGEKIERTFQGFGYDIIRARNLKAEQIKSFLSEKELKQGIKNAFFTDYASLVVCFVGHGSKDALFGTDGIPVSLKSIRQDSFNHGSFPDLKGKPKVFIMLTCQECKMHQNLGDSSIHPIRATIANDGPSNSEIDGNSHEPPIEGHFIYLNNNSSALIHHLCAAMKNEYMGEINQGKKIRDLYGLLLSLPSMIMSRLAGDERRQVFEIRSTLTKTLSFKSTETPGTFLTEYDGEYHDLVGEDNTTGGLKMVNEELHYNLSKRIGRSTFSLVFEGKFQNAIPVAVKCIISANRRNIEIEILRKAKGQNNILDFIYTSRDNLFTYIVTKLFDVTLREYLKEAYKGPKLENERDALFQLAKGLAYLHKQKIIHGGISPDNILICSQNEGGKIQMKLGGFGFSKNLDTNRRNKEFTKADLDYYFWHKRDWMAPELKSETESNQSHTYYDFPMDIYCMGKVFGCILKIDGGKLSHGNQSDRTDLITTEQHQNLVLSPMSFAEKSSVLELIRSMLDISPEKRPNAAKVFKDDFFETPRLLDSEPIKVSEELSYYSNEVLGGGTYGYVFIGLFNGGKTAVKRILKDPTEDGSELLREVDALKEVGDGGNTNILRLMNTTDGTGNQIDFFFIVTERCHGTLMDWIERKYKGPVFDGGEKDILSQVTKGLKYLHDSRVIHRDIKPNNILIFVPSDESRPQIKLADFGISRILAEGNDQGICTNTNVKKPSGTRGYMAPELHKLLKYDIKVDIFALGCVFGCTLSEKGKHPFGEDPDAQAYRIRYRPKDEPYMSLKLEELKESNRCVFELIKSMVDEDHNKRPTTKDILNHAFFKS